MDHQRDGSDVSIQQALMMASAAGGGGGLLLDTYAIGNGNAYSVRKLRTAYAGNCLKVRRSSDNTELDIGFSSGALDTASLLAFVGAGNGFVTAWYDQSGNSATVTQATTSLQPRIVNGGVLDTENGLPAVVFDGTDDALYTSGFVTNALNNRRNTIGAVARFTRTSSMSEAVISLKTTGLAADYQSGIFLERRTTNISANRMRGDGTNNYIGQGGADSNITAMMNVFYFVNAISNTEGMWIDNTSKTLSAMYSAGVTAITDYMSGGLGVRRIVLGNGNSGFNDTTFGRPMAGKIAEVVLWDSDMNANRSAIYTDQKTYFSTP
jgi:hypothetical protein